MLPDCRRSELPHPVLRSASLGARSHHHYLGVASRPSPSAALRGLGLPKLMVVLLGSRKREIRSKINERG